MTKTKMYTIPTNGSSSNASFTYNFDNVSTVRVDDSNALSNITGIFSEYKIPEYYASFNITAPSQNGSTPHQISYYDNITNSTILYSIEYLHVCPIPVTTSTTIVDISYGLCIILECKSTDPNKNTLLIIIPLSPIKYIDSKDKKGRVTSTLTVQPETNINNLTRNIKDNNNNLTFDINAFIPSTKFNIYSAGNNKIIYTTEIKYDYKNLEGLFNTLVPDYTKEISPINAISYISSSAPSKQNILVQNDIYIDCYKVGESSKIKGGMPNPLTDKQASKEDKKEKKKNKGIATLNIVYFVILGFYVFCIICIHIFGYANPTNTTVLDTILEWKKIPIIFTGFYSLILIIIIFSM